jgi:uncharacterized membrane protein
MSKSSNPRHARGSEEYSRVLGFTDGIFAFAITLLVVSITVPEPDSSGGPASKADVFGMLRGLWPQIQAFLVSFVIVAYAWIGHHQLMARMEAVDLPFMAWNLLYLLLIVLLPLMTALIGLYESNPEAVTVYAIYFAVLFLVDLIGFRLVWQRRLLREGVEDRHLRHGIWAKAIPIGVFLVSIPLVWSVGPGWATLSWILIWPMEALLDRLLRPV